MYFTDCNFNKTTGSCTQNSSRTPTKVETELGSLCACKALIWKQRTRGITLSCVGRCVWFDNKSSELNKQIGQTFMKADRYPASQAHLAFDRSSLKKPSDWIHEYKQRPWQLARNLELEQRGCERNWNAASTLCVSSRALCMSSEKSWHWKSPPFSPLSCSKLLPIQLYARSRMMAHCTWDKDAIRWESQLSQPL